MSQNSRNFAQGVHASDAIVQRTDELTWQNPISCEDKAATDLLGHRCTVLHGIAAVASSGQMVVPMSDMLVAGGHTGHAVAVVDDGRSLTGASLLSAARFSQDSLVCGGESWR